MAVVRGDVVWHDFSATGAPIQKIRPALVIQNNIANRRSPMTILAAIRADMDKELPVLVRVPKGVAGLKKDSVVDCGHVATRLQAELGRPFGRMPAEYMTRIDQALRRSLSL